MIEARRLLKHLLALHDAYKVYFGILNSNILETFKYVTSQIYIYV